MEKFIKLERRRNIPYTINHSALKGGTITFSGAKNGKTDKKDVPEEVVDYLAMSTSCFQTGSLYIVTDEVREDMVEEEALKNSHTIEEVEKILNGNTNKMKSELSKIECQDEKDFIISVAKNMKLDSSAKQTFICDWAGVKKEVVFFDEE